MTALGSAPRGEVEPKPEQTSLLGISHNITEVFVLAFFKCTNDEPNCLGGQEVPGTLHGLEDNPKGKVKLVELKVHQIFPPADAWF